MVKTNQECCANVVDNSTNTLGAEGESPTPLISLSDSSRVEGRTLCPPKVVTPRSPGNSSYLEHTANLDGFEPLKLYKERVKACDPTYIVQECGCGRSILPSTCMSVNCVNCEPWVNRRRAFSIFNRFVPDEMCTVKTVIYTVLTVPKHARYRFTDPKAWQRVRVKMWRILKNNFGGYFGVECSHPIGSDSEEFHPHLNFLWRQRKGYNPYINVRALREAWANVIGVRKTTAHSQYTSSRARIMHWCKYVSRIFPGLHYWTGPVRWYGKYPRNNKPEPCICGLCGEPMRTIGQLHRLDVDDWYETGWKIGRAPPWYNDELIQRFRRSNKCNGRATPK